MKYHFIVLSCLLLVWTLTVFVSCQGDTKPPPEPEIKVITVSDGIKVECPNDYKILNTKTGEKEKIVHLPYLDENAGEYDCVKESDENMKLQIFVKFRTCDNCIELDAVAIIGIVVGDVVATIGVGFGVYLLAAHVRSGPPPTPRKIASDRRQLVPSEVGGSSSNDHYQPLRHAGQKDEYDVIKNKRR